MNIYREDHRIFQQSVKKFLEAEVMGNVTQWEADHYFPSEIFEKLGAQGYLGILVPEELGGIGEDYKFAAAWCEEFGRTPAIGFTTGVNMHSLVILPAIVKYGSAELKEKWVQNALLGKAIGAYAFSEPGAGSDLAAIRTTAIEDGNDYIINGSKTFITNGARADFVIVLTKTSPDKGYNGFTSFVIDTTSPGYSVSRKLEKLGWHSSDTAELSFTDLRVSKSTVLGKVGSGWKQAMANLEWERIMLSLGALGAADQCLTDTIKYTNERSVFGKKISEFDLNKTSITQMSTNLRAAKSFCRLCVEQLDNKTIKRDMAALAKLYTTELAIDIADRCLQLHGGYGYTTEFKPELWLRDLRLNTLGGGTSEIMAEIASKDLF